MLCNLEQEGVLVRTPAQDYDDSYCIEYARRFDAFIVTNDRFRDYLDGMKQKVQSGSASEDKIDMIDYSESAGRIAKAMKKEIKNTINFERISMQDFDP